jgi:RNA polymerase sigma-70 factor (ECF subfamily)
LADCPTSLSLLERVAARDEAAWERLVRLYTPLVCYWCRRGQLSGADIDDVTQEVFQAVAADLGRFRSEHRGGTFRGWLRGIARHKLLDHYRRRDRQPRAEGGSDAYQRFQEAPDLLPDWEDTDPEQEVGALYRRALELVRGEFEDRTWQAFWLAGVEQRPAADVAAELGMTEAAVRKAKSRVLRRLKEEAGDLIA